VIDIETLCDLKWSGKEKKVAREAFDKAYKREMQHIQREVSKRVKSFRENAEVWKLHDYLSEVRREVNRKYDYRYSMLILVFGRDTL
jgi:hypothetical protein